MLLHLLFVYIYLSFDILMMVLNDKVSILYLLLLLFCSMKVITNYRVCSVAYLECKIRNIRRDESIMNRFLDPIVDLRYTDHIYSLTILTFIILIYNFVYLKRIQELRSILLE